MEAASRLDRAALEADGGRLWRRKFIWHPADSARPPYCGSCTKPPAPVGPRRFAAKHPDLDYDVASDEEWEEEPEGEDLSDADDADDDDDRASGATAATAGDGFLVADDYVSGADGDDSGFGGAAVSGLPAGASAYMRLLAAQLDTARRGGRLALVSRLGVGDAPPPSSTTAHTSAPATTAPTKGVLQCDVALLAALAAVPWRQDDGAPPSHIVVPPPSTEDGGDDRPRSAAGERGASSPGASPSACKRGRAAQAPTDLVPALRAFMARAGADLRAAPKLWAAFQAAHPDRKITKAWALDAIKAAGVWKGGRWTLHPEGGAVAAPRRSPGAPSSAPPPLAEPWASLVASLKKGPLPGDEATASALVAPVHGVVGGAVPTAVVDALVGVAATADAPRALRRVAALAAAHALSASADEGADAASAHAAVLGGGRLPAAAASMLRSSSDNTRRTGAALLASAAKAAASAGRPATALATARATGAAFGTDGLARALAVTSAGGDDAGSSDALRVAGHTALAVATLVSAPDAAGAPLATPSIALALAAAAAATAGTEGVAGPARGVARRSLQALAAMAALPTGSALLAPGGAAHAATAAAVAAATGNDGLGEDGAGWARVLAAVVE